MNKGDRIYWEDYYDKSIGSATIKQIEVEHCDVDETYSLYYTSDNTFIEDYNCLKESDPKVKEYKKAVSSFIKESTSDIYQKVLGRKPTKAEKDIIDKTIEYMSSLNLASELEYKFNYFD